MNEFLEAFINTLLPATAIIAAIYAALRWTGRLNAATRYATWWVTLLALVAMPPVYHAIQNEEPLLQVDINTKTSEFNPTSNVLSVDPTTAVPWLFILWAAGSAFLILRLPASYLSLRRLKKNASLVPLPAKTLGRSARILVSSNIKTPIAVGFLHPALIVPVHLAHQLSADELDCVLIHEYAHLARRDDWMHLLGRVIQAILWFHPLAWFILRQISLERELACDDWVVHRTGDARAYAATLLKLSEFRLAWRGPRLASGILGRKPDLSRRIEKLMRMRSKFAPSLSGARFVLCTAFVLVLCLVALQSPGIVELRRVEAASAQREGFLAGLKAAGYNHLDVDEIIELKNNGVSAKYIGEMTEVFGKLSVKQLVQLHQHGVSTGSVRRAKDFKSGLSVEQIIKLKNSGALN